MKLIRHRWIDCAYVAALIEISACQSSGDAEAAQGHVEAAGQAHDLRSEPKHDAKEAFFGTRAKHYDDCSESACESIELHVDSRPNHREAAQELTRAIKVRVPEALPAIYWSTKVQAELVFEQAGTRVVCTYRAKSHQLSPSRSLALQSCDHGASAGDTITLERATLTLDCAGLLPFAKVHVELHEIEPCGVMACDPTKVDDANPCTIDACDPAGGVSHMSAPAGTACGDSDPCNGSDLCDGIAKCVHSAPTLDDGNPCTKDSCSAATGIQHELQPDGTSCDDANACNGHECCQAGVCLGASSGPRQCAPKVVFSTDFEAAAVPNQIDPGVAALEGVQGFAGLGNGARKFAGSFLRSPTGQRVTLTLNGLPAHDTLDLKFLFAAIDSLDGTGVFPAGDFFVVTVDSAVIFRESFANALPTQVQSYVPPAGVELARRLPLGFTAGGPDTVYSDSAYDLGSDPTFSRISHTASTVAISFEFLGEGIQALDDESWAMDNLEVSVSDSHDCGGCGTLPVIDDNNACTSDSCDPLLGVRHEPVAVGTNCADDNVCNGGETCNNTGMCVAGTPRNCDDGNPCNGVEQCDPVDGCRPGDAPRIADDNPCTVDACSATGGITHVPVATGTDCGAEMVCNAAGLCVPVR